MQIREPIYSVGDKLIDKKGAIGTVYSIYSYCFEKDEFFYSIEENGLKVKAETNLSLYKYEQLKELEKD